MDVVIRIESTHRWTGRTPLISFLVPPEVRTMTSSRVVTRSAGFQAEGGISRTGLAVSAVLSLLMIFALAFCLKQNIQATSDWTNEPSTTWTIAIIYVDSLVFIIGTALLVFGFRVNSSTRACSSLILPCLLCYMSIKVSPGGTTHSANTKNNRIPILLSRRENIYHPKRARISAQVKALPLQLLRHPAPILCDYCPRCHLLHSSLYSRRNLHHWHKISAAHRLHNPRWVSQPVPFNSPRHPATTYLHL